MVADYPLCLCRTVFRSASYCSTMDDDAADDEAGDEAVSRKQSVEQASHLQSAITANH